MHCLLTTGYWILDIGYCLLVIGCCLLAIVYACIVYWLLAIVYWLLAIVYWLLDVMKPIAVHHSSLRVFVVIPEVMSAAIEEVSHFPLAHLWHPIDNRPPLVQRQGVAFS